MSYLDGSLELKKEKIEDDTSRKIVVEWENAILKTRNRFIWRLSAKLDSETDFAKRLVDNEIKCVFEFSMARGIYRSTKTERIKIYHLMPTRELDI